MTEGLVLASGSPVRARLLAAAGLQFRVDPAAIDEGSLKGECQRRREGAIECALALAEAKARYVAPGHDRALVIGADQILACGDQWFDKPAHLGEARRQLETLRGRTHELTTAVCVFQGASRLWRTVSQPRLTMRDFSNGFLDEYLAAEGAAALNSVGGYRLEGMGVQLFDRVEGDYFAILGLPLLDLLSFLRLRGEVPS
jgi:septum formation protein